MPWPKSNFLTLPGRSSFCPNLRCGKNLLSKINARLHDARQNHRASRTQKTLLTMLKTSSIDEINTEALHRRILGHNQFGTICKFPLQISAWNHRGRTTKRQNVVE
ncbi:hypothetical protein SLA2020_176760 [Shorea laevis]